MKQQCHEWDDVFTGQAIPATPGLQLMAQRTEGRTS
jgi:hypothetical protein